MGDCWIINHGPTAGIYFESREDIEKLRDRFARKDTNETIERLRGLDLPFVLASRAQIEFFRAMEKKEPPAGFVSPQAAMRDLSKFVKKEEKP